MGASQSKIVSPVDSTANKNDSNQNEIQDKNPKQDFIESFDQADKTKEASIPELPERNILIETVLEADVDKVYEMIYETDSFFETIAVKNYDEVENFSMSAWQVPNENEALSTRTMHYEFAKSWAFKKFKILVNQDQIKSAWSTPGLAYGVDSDTRSTGIQYADYFHIDCHTRLESFGVKKTKLTVVANIVWDKFTFLKSTIETETMNGLENYYEVLEKELQTSFNQSEISKPQPSLNELNSKSIGQNERLDNELSSKSTGQNERLDCFEEPAIVFVFIMTFLINFLLCLSTRA